MGPALRAKTAKIKSLNISMLAKNGPLSSSGAYSGPFFDHEGDESANFRQFTQYIVAGLSKNLPHSVGQKLTFSKYKKAATSYLFARICVPYFLCG